MISFDKQNHTYKMGDKVIPSVSQILHFIFPDKYSTIPIEILQNKAEYGNFVHELMEIIDKEQINDYEALNGLKMVYEYTPVQEFTLESYIELKNKENIEVLEQEQIVVYKDLYAGRFDKAGKVKGKTALLDVKTTAELDKEYLSWQLSFYELAKGTKYQKLYCIWASKRKPCQLVEIKRKSKKELLKKIEEYRRENE